MSGGPVLALVAPGGAVGIGLAGVPSHPETGISRAADALSRRDFIDLVLIMSAFGKADWFVVLSALAVPAFFLALLVVAWNDRRVARSSS